MKKVYFIRHGQSEANANWEIQQFIEEHDIELTEMGRSQANGAGFLLEKKLKKLGYFEKMEVYVSPWKRAVQTFRFIEKRTHLPIVEDTVIQFDPRITEHHMNLVNHPKNWETFVKYKESDWLIPEFMNTEFEGGEKLKNVQKRAKAFLRRLKSSKAEVIIVVAHGQFIKLVLSALDGIDPHDIVHPKNCEIIERDLE